MTNRELLQSLVDEAGSIKAAAAWLRISQSAIRLALKTGRVGDKTMTAVHRILDERDPEMREILEEVRGWE